MYLILNNHFHLPSPKRSFINPGTLPLFIAFVKHLLVDYILITNICALIIIYSKNINLLYMFRASSAHLQEDTVVHVQHMVLSLSMRVPGGL